VVSNSALVALLNRDTDKRVTFLVCRDDSSRYDLTLTSSEHATYRPVLELDLKPGLTFTVK
jgi:hypothetical protein